MMTVTWLINLLPIQMAKNVFQFRIKKNIVIFIDRINSFFFLIFIPSEGGNGAGFVTFVKSF